MHCICTKSYFSQNHRGGGVAGITAAVSLAPFFTPSAVANNLKQALTNASVHDFMILEYRDTLGGRAWHKPFGKDKDGKPYNIEMGANWVRVPQPLTEARINHRRSKVWEIQEERRIRSGSWWVSEISSIKLPLTLKTGAKVRAEDPLL